MFFECEFPTAIAFQASGGQMFSTQNRQQAGGLAHGAGHTMVVAVYKPDREATAEYRPA